MMRSNDCVVWAASLRVRKGLLGSLHYKETNCARGELVKNKGEALKKIDYTLVMSAAFHGQGMQSWPKDVPRCLYLQTSGHYEVTIKYSIGRRVDQCPLGMSLNYYQQCKAASAVFAQRSAGFLPDFLNAGSHIPCLRPQITCRLAGQAHQGQNIW